MADVMSDGPTDFGSGYFFESQKGISDRRRALGLDQGPTRSHGFESRSSSGSGGSGGGFAEFIGKAVLWMMVIGVVVSGIAAFLITKFILAPLIMWLIASIFGGGRRGRR